MNKKAWYTFRIVLGGYLAWLGIRMLIEMVNEKPNNMVFMCTMSVIFILIGLAYAIYYVKKIFDLKKEDHRIEEEDKEVFNAGKDQADQRRQKNVLLESGPNEEIKKGAEQEKTDKETAQSVKEIEKEAENPDDKVEGKTEKSGCKAGLETEQPDDKVKKETEKLTDKNEEDAEDKMIEEGKKQKSEMEELVEETQTEIENDYEER